MGRFRAKQLIAMGVLGGGAIDPIPNIYPTFGDEAAPTAAATTQGVDVDATTNWTAVSSTLTSVADPRTAAPGAYSLNIAATAAAGKARTSITANTGDFLRLEAWVKTVGAGTTMTIVDISNNVNLSGAYIEYATWKRLLYTIHAGAAAKQMEFRVLTNGTNGRVDDVSLKKITLSSMLANPKTCIPGNVIAGVNLDVPSWGNFVGGVLGGLMINLDSITTPLNGVALLHNNYTAYLKKLVAGTWSTVTSANITPVSRGLLQIRNNGTSYEMWYNGAQVGTTQTIADAFTGTIACQMAADSEVSFY